MVKLLSKSALVLGMMALPSFAGALRLEVDTPASNPEALRDHAVLLARITACRSPEKTAVTATAEGTIDGVLQSIPLKVLSLSTAGTFAVLREWPATGTWIIKMVATNPDYKDYATSVVVPARGDSVQVAEAKNY